MGGHPSSSMLAAQNMAVVGLAGPHQTSCVLSNVGSGLIFVVWADDRCHGLWPWTWCQPLSQGRGRWLALYTQGGEVWCR